MSEKPAETGSAPGESGSAEVEATATLEDFATFNHEIDLSDETDNIMTLNANAVCIQDPNATNEDIGVIVEEDENHEEGMDDILEDVDQQLVIAGVESQTPASRFVPISSSGRVNVRQLEVSDSDKDRLIQRLKGELKSKSASFQALVRDNEKNVNAAKNYIIKVERTLKAKIAQLSGELAHKRNEVSVLKQTLAKEKESNSSKLTIINSLKKTVELQQNSNHILEAQNKLLLDGSQHGAVSSPQQYEVLHPSQEELKNNGVFMLREGPKIEMCMKLPIKVDLLENSKMTVFGQDIAAVHPRQAEKRRATLLQAVELLYNPLNTQMSHVRKQQLIFVLLNDVLTKYGFKSKDDKYILGPGDSIDLSSKVIIKRARAEGLTQAPPRAESGDADCSTTRVMEIIKDMKDKDKEASKIWLGGGTEGLSISRRSNSTSQLNPEQLKRKSTGGGLDFSKSIFKKKPKRSLQPDHIEVIRENIDALKNRVSVNRRSGEALENSAGGSGEKKPEGLSSSKPPSTKRPPPALTRLPPPLRKIPTTMLGNSKGMGNSSSAPSLSKLFPGGPLPTSPVAAMISEQQTPEDCIRDTQKEKAIMDVATKNTKLCFSILSTILAKQKSVISTYFVKDWPEPYSLALIPMTDAAAHRICMVPFLVKNLQGLSSPRILRSSAIHFLTYGAVVLSKDPIHKATCKSCGLEIFAACMDRHVGSVHPELASMELPKYNGLGNLWSFMVEPRYEPEFRQGIGLVESMIFLGHNEQPKTLMPPLTRAIKQEVGAEEDENSSQQQFECKYCIKRFTSVSGWESHLESDHKPSRPFKCPNQSCPSSFCTKISLSHHLKTCKHQQESQATSLEIPIRAKDRKKISLPQKPDPDVKPPEPKKKPGTKPAGNNLVNGADSLTDENLTSPPPPQVTKSGRKVTPARKILNNREYASEIGSSSALGKSASASNGTSASSTPKTSSTTQNTSTNATMSTSTASNVTAKDSSGKADETHSRLMLSPKKNKRQQKSPISKLASDETITAPQATLAASAVVNPPVIASLGKGRLGKKRGVDKTAGSGSPSKPKHRKLSSGASGSFLRIRSPSPVSRVIDIGKATASSSSETPQQQPTRMSSRGAIPPITVDIKIEIEDPEYDKVAGSSSAVSDSAKKANSKKPAAVAAATTAAVTPKAPPVKRDHAKVMAGKATPSFDIIRPSRDSVEKRRRRNPQISYSSILKDVIININEHLKKRRQFYKTEHPSLSKYALKAFQLRKVEDKIDSDGYSIREAFMEDFEREFDVVAKADVIKGEDVEVCKAFAADMIQYARDELAFFGESLSVLEKEINPMLSGNPELAFKCVMTKILEEEVKPSKMSRNFLARVNKSTHPDYYDIVTDPICLAEITAKIQGKGYPSKVEFIADFRLMHANSVTYNGSKNEITKDAWKIFCMVKDGLKKYKDYVIHTPPSSGKDK